MLRPPSSTESNHLIALAVSTGLFTHDEAQSLLGGVLDAYHAVELPSDHTVLVSVAEDTDRALGWAYLAPDDHAIGVWNLWWIGVSPDAHGTGVGAELIDGAEAVVRRSGGRLLIVETSALDTLARARRFYEKHGFQRCGLVPDFYGPGDAKVIFARRSAS